MSLWQQVLTRFRAEFGDKVTDSWMTQIRFSGRDNGEISLTAPTRFVRDWVQNNYAARLKDFFAAEGVKVLDIAIRVDAAQHTAATELAAARLHEASPHKPAQAKADQNGEGLNRDLRFDRFVVGKSNELAYAAAKRITESDDIPFNPLFLYGGVGLGKTHLMHAIGLSVLERDPSKRVVYISAEKFMYEFIAAIRFKDTHAFKKKYRNVDLLMVDDVQFIANKDSTQEEFFHTFNTLIDNRCQVVITADRSPTDLEGIQDRIVSRLGWGLVADIHPTDYELRLGILQARAEAHPDVDIPTEVLSFLARRITSNVRELEGALIRVIAFATLVKRPLTLEMTKDALQDLIRANDRKLSIDEIQRATADYFNLRLSEMLSERRSRQIARPRQVAMYLCKQMTTRSLPDIGRKFGGRDHTTVLHAIRKIEDLRQGDSQLNDDLLHLTRMLEG